MNILPKYNIRKLYNLNSIPFDILPRTRYVIIKLRYMKFFILRGNVINPGIKAMKNLYLTYFEKTYAVDSSVISIIFLLRINFPINYFYLQEFYLETYETICGKVINYMMLYQKGAL